jgi:hypothetical protein
VNHILILIKCLNDKFVTGHNQYSKTPQTTHDLCTHVSKCVEFDGFSAKHSEPFCDFKGPCAVFMNLFFAVVMRHKQMLSVFAVGILICVLQFTICVIYFSTFYICHISIPFSNVWTECCGRIVLAPSY